jgi:hypothetical protein
MSEHENLLTIASTYDIFNFMSSIFVTMETKQIFVVNAFRLSQFVSLLVLVLVLMIQINRLDQIEVVVTF